MTVLSQQNANLSNLTTQRRGEGWMELMIDIDVRDREHLDTVLQALRSTEKVAAVTRVKAG